jgi:predicted ATP-dependent endonuclease of OLD family
MEGEMRLLSAKVGPFKSILHPQTVEVGPKATVLVGMNEAGKTVFLHALQKTQDALGVANFDPVEDYPRKDLSTYLKRHQGTPEEVVTLTFALTKAEVKEINDTFHTALPDSYSFSITRKYDNALTIGNSVDERPVVAHLSTNSSLTPAASSAVQSAVSVRAIPKVLEGVATSAEDKALVNVVNQRLGQTKWDNVIKWEVWKWLESRMPLFLYFGDYEVLPSKQNMIDLANRVNQAQSNPALLSPEYRGVLGLLRMADISVTDFAASQGYEPLQARIEAVSIRLTDQIMEFWKQNEDLEVGVDIKHDATDTPPYNNGPNLYLRIKNRRHRGVSTPFRQRSRGFIWFFSFLVWFDSIREQFAQTENKPARPLILLLDEPGLSLHALAQADFLRYIDDLAERHQVIYTTHSPFMINSDRLQEIRIVEDQKKIGTVISKSLESTDPRTIYPLQAALGWTIAQNLFIAERNLLVEGPADLIYLRSLSARLEAEGRVGLRQDVVIAPTGGLDKLATFVALLGANGLKLAVLHDYKGSQDQRLMDLARQKMISPKAILNASQFRDLSDIGAEKMPTDLEDLFAEAEYLAFFNGAYAKELKGEVKSKDLPAGDRIIARIEEYLEVKSIVLRPDGGFNHYRPASYFASLPLNALEANTLSRFEHLFKSVNALF